MRSSLWLFLGVVLLPPNSSYHGGSTVVVVINAQDIPTTTITATPVPTPFQTPSSSASSSQQQPPATIPTVNDGGGGNGPTAATTSFTCNGDSESHLQVVFTITEGEWYTIDEVVAPTSPPYGDDGTYNDDYYHDDGTYYNTDFFPSIIVKPSWMSQDRVSNDSNGDGTVNYFYFAMAYGTYDEMLLEGKEINLCIPNDECYFVLVQQMPTQYYSIYLNDEPIIVASNYNETSYFVPYRDIHPNFRNDASTTTTSPHNIIYPCYGNEQFHCTITEISSRVTTTTTTDGNDGGGGGGTNACIPNCDLESESLFEYRYFTGDHQDHSNFDYRLEELVVVTSTTNNNSNNDTIFNGDAFNNETATNSTNHYYSIETRTIVSCESFHCANTKSTTLDVYDMVIERKCLPKKKMIRREEGNDAALLATTTTTTFERDTCYRFLVGNYQLSRGIPFGGPDIYVSYDNEVLLHSDLVRMEVLHFGPGCDEILALSPSSTFSTLPPCSPSTSSVVEFLMYRQQEDIHSRSGLPNEHPVPLSWRITSHYRYDEYASLPVLVYEKSQEDYFIPDGEYDQDGSYLVSPILSSGYSLSVRSTSLYYDRICIPKDPCITFELDKRDDPLNSFYSNYYTTTLSWYELKLDDVYYRVGNFDFLTFMTEELETTIMGPSCGAIRLSDGHDVCNIPNVGGNTLFEFKIQTPGRITDSTSPSSYGCYDYSYCAYTYGLIPYDDLHWKVVDQHFYYLIASESQFDHFKHNTTYAMVSCFYLFGNEECTRPEFILETTLTVEDYELKRDGVEIVGYTYWDSWDKYVTIRFAYTTKPWKDCNEYVFPVVVVVVIVGTFLGGFAAFFWCAKKRPAQSNGSSVAGANTVSDPHVLSNGSAMAIATPVISPPLTSRPESMIEMTPTATSTDPTSTAPIAEATALPTTYVNEGGNANDVSSTSNGMEQHQHETQQHNDAPKALSNDLDDDDWA